MTDPLTHLGYSYSAAARTVTCNRCNRVVLLAAHTLPEPDMGDLVAALARATGCDLGHHPWWVEEAKQLRKLSDEGIPWKRAIGALASGVSPSAPGP